jgi:hypothetical protein
MADDAKQGLRGDELADEAGAAVTPLPEEELAGNGGLRGEGLADDVDERPAPPEGDLGEDGVRGDGLADGAA